MTQSTSLNRSRRRSTLLVSVASFIATSSRPTSRFAATTLDLTQERNHRPVWTNGPCSRSSPTSSGSDGSPAHRTAGTRGTSRDARRSSTAGFHAIRQSESRKPRLSVDLHAGPRRPDKRPIEGRRGPRSMWRAILSARCEAAGTVGARRTATPISPPWVSAVARLPVPNPAARARASASRLW